jgi:hypothetical protein
VKFGVETDLQILYEMLFRNVQLTNVHVNTFKKNVYPIPGVRNELSLYERTPVHAYVTVCDQL